MPKYVITSERVGELGAEFDAEAAAATGVNIDALVEGGFISAHKSAKSAKKDLDTSEE